MLANGACHASGRPVPFPYVLRFKRMDLRMASRFGMSNGRPAAAAKGKRPWR